MNIYVGNLPYEVKEDDLRQLMEEFGVVSSVKLILDKDLGRSKGFGFVEMENNDEANNAIRSLNGKMHHNRPISVKEATPRSY
jgi:RNA recognition motif-containing protein